MKTHEILTGKLPENKQGMATLARSYLLMDRGLAKQHGLTIDGSARGSTGAQGQLPVVRTDWFLMGGALIPAGGLGQEEKRTTPFEERCSQYIRALWPSLQHLLVNSLSDSLEQDYQVFVQVSSSPAEQFIEATRDTFFSATRKVGNSKVPTPSNRYYRPLLDTTVEEVIKGLNFTTDPLRTGVPCVLFSWMLVRSE